LQEFTDQLPDVVRRKMNELALFAGAGGGILGGHLLGWRTVCAVEWEPYAACILAARQNDGLLPSFPIWDDVQTFDGRPWRGIVDVISGGFPCQDISAAGKGAGIDGERSGMWREMARIIHEVRPKFVFVENSPMLTSRGLGTVLGDLAAMGFDARWGVLGAADVGAPHQRDRIWIVAESKLKRLERQRSQPGQEKISEFGNSGSLADTKLSRTKWWKKQQIGSEKKWNRFRNFNWWKVEPNVGRVANGVAARVDRLKAIGNGQVPLVAATAWEDLGDKR
jgi:DNA (cytosine-5)-methyltransferase 1